MSSIRNQSPSLRWEKDAWSGGKLLVAGVDEVGRGAWAGPIVAAAVALPADPAFRARLTRALRRAETPIRDSKQMSPQQRRRAVSAIQDIGMQFAVASIPASDIDVVGLGLANRQVLCDAVQALSPEPDHVLVDAFALPNLRCSHDAIVHGDSISFAIALASIVAKAHRDSLMIELCERFPVYGFSAHKGYGTAQHRAALLTHGPLEHHRRSFRPVAELAWHAAHDR
ncbi:MAG TPA: ribonuclease HII [Thermomicrobiales bacterium]|nr:ribonuclease HII [Thermomicrobiales bacterium]